ncbi:unnamed protein product [Commensalibacter communis]|uniref:Uncharacterized protein n=1 Tax=Commensalibacter communis TaxID=2972786 RepID=A0A9W4TRM3_9PROT|nr:hypothetical protein [Commensalibacter communis]CAI3956365.1 unnamed protein product [Commensalibacter communis]CAI3958369.1 unnamed protein product [Commensalibacter communis]CAI3958747.1 unnamed protein product [Commensalibacter communis]CAI3959439.1 unnamed protein product [Commensalibacter communis]CAI3959937.1 unnamed protein product [Commensalibacter communis]
MVERFCYIFVMTLLLCVSINANAQENDVPFTGVFVMGSGSGCYGHLYIKTKTIEWISYYHNCKISPYKILEKQFDDKGKRIVYLIEKPSKNCGMKVIEFIGNPESSERIPPYTWWNLIAYKTIDEYKKRSIDGFGCAMISVD